MAGQPLPGEWPCLCPRMDGQLCACGVVENLLPKPQYRKRIWEAASEEDQLLRAEQDGAGRLPRSTGHRTMIWPPLLLCLHRQHAVQRALAFGLPGYLSSCKFISDTSFLSLFS